MDMNVSPDLDAWICYLIVLLLGVWTGGVQISKRLRNLPGKWIMVNTWALFFAYTAVPVTLFWLLDRTGAIHDTSLFAAVLIGVGYQQILTGASGTIRAPGEVSAFWKPFAAWADAIASSISDRVAVNSQKFDERLLSRISADPATLQKLLAVVMVHCPDPAQMAQDLMALDAKEPFIGTAGVQRKKAELLYQSLKIFRPQQFDYLLFKNKITGPVKYLWYAREGRSKLIALVVASVLVALGVAAVRELRNPEYRARYYAWRMVKLNGTDSDRFRARMHLRNYMDGAPGSYGKLIGSLRNPALPVKTADEILALVLEMKDSAAQHGVDIRGQLAESMRTDNADIRERIQKLLLYMADRDHLEVPEPLKTWHSDPKNSSSDVDLLIRQWHSVKPATVAPDLASAVLKGVKPGPSRARAPIP